MIVGTGGSRIVPRNTSDGRRRTLLEVSQSCDETGERKQRDRSSSDSTQTGASLVRPRREIQMKQIERSSSSKTNEPLDFKTTWTNVVSKRTIDPITITQKQTLRKFEETNEMLHQFNLLSETTFLDLQKSYKSHIALLSSLKEDLSQIFPRVRALKEKLTAKYPDAFEATREAIEKLKERQKMAMEIDPFQCAGSTDSYGRDFGKESNYVEDDKLEACSNASCGEASVISGLVENKSEEDDKETACNTQERKSVSKAAPCADCDTCIEINDDSLDPECDKGVNSDSDSDKDNEPSKTELDFVELKEHDASSTE